MASELDLGVGTTQTGRVELNHGVVPFRHHPHLTFSRKPLRTDEGEVLIASKRLLKSHRLNRSSIRRSRAEYDF